MSLGLEAVGFSWLTIRYPTGEVQQLTVTLDLPTESNFHTNLFSVKPTRNTGDLGKSPSAFHF